MDHRTRRYINDPFIFVLPWQFFDQLDQTCQSSSSHLLSSFLNYCWICHNPIQALRINSVLTFFMEIMKQASIIWCTNKSITSNMCTICRYRPTNWADFTVVCPIANPITSKPISKHSITTQMIEFVINVNSNSPTPSIFIDNKSQFSTKNNKIIIVHKFPSKRKQFFCWCSSRQYGFAYQLAII